MARWVTYAEAGERLGMTRGQLAQAVRAGILPVRPPAKSGRGHVAHVDIVGMRPREPAPAGWLTLAEAAEAWAVSPSTVRRWCVEGLQAVKVGGRWLVAPEPEPTMPPVDSEPGLTLAKAATTVGLPPIAHRRAIAAGQVPSVPARRGGLRVELADVVAWIGSLPPKV